MPPSEERKDRGVGSVAAEDEEPPLSAEDPRLRFRVWVDGELVDETWIDASEPHREQIADAAQQRHMALVAKPHEEGSRWLVEIYDPGKPEGEAYAWFGTDATGMVDPLLVCPFCEANVRAQPGVDDNAVVAAHWAESPDCGRAWAEGGCS